MLADDTSVEALTRLTRLARERGKDGERWLERTIAAQLRQLAEPALAVAVETGEPIGRVLARAVAARATPALAAQLMARCDQTILDEAVPLREVALEATRIVLENHRTFSTETDERHRDALAQLLNRFAQRLYELEHRNEALVALEEAVELDRKLAGERPEVYMPRLSSSLNNLGNTLGELARFEEAAAVVKEAVALDRQLLGNRQQDELVGAHLALSLHNLAARLSDLGKWDEALVPAQESVARFQRIERAGEVYRTRFAESLSTLGAILGALGATDEALAESRRALEVFERQEAQWPNVFTPRVAYELLNLGIFLTQLGHPEEAISKQRQAERRYRRLAQARPEVFAADLALCHLNLSTTLRAVSQPAEALAAAREAVERLRWLGKRRPEVFEDDLAHALHNLGTLLAEEGTVDEAIQILGEAMRRLRSLVRTRPRIHRGDLARSLTVLSAVLSKNEQFDEAIEMAREAVVEYTWLASADGDRDLDLKPESAAIRYHDLATAWDHLRAVLLGDGNVDGALEAARETVALRRRLVGEDHERYGIALAASLGDLAVIHCAQSSIEEALATVEEAVQLLSHCEPGRAAREIRDHVLGIYRWVARAAGTRVDQNLVEQIAVKALSSGSPTRTEKPGIPDGEQTV